MRRPADSWERFAEQERQRALADLDEFYGIGFGTLEPIHPHPTVGVELPSAERPWKPQPAPRWVDTGSRVLTVAAIALCSWVVIGIVVGALVALFS